MLIEILGDFNTHTSSEKKQWVHTANEKEYTFSPYEILANFSDLNRRDRIFEKLTFTKESLETLKDSSKKPLDRLKTFQKQLGDENKFAPKILGMFLDYIEDDSVRQAILDVYNPENQTRIKNGMRKPRTLRRLDLAVALISGSGALIITGLATPLLMGSRYVSQKLWNDYPMTRKIILIAGGSGTGFLAGKGITKKDNMGYLAALTLGIFGAPKAAENLLSGHVISHWDSVGIAFTGALAHRLLFSKNQPKLN